MGGRKKSLGLIMCILYILFLTPLGVSGAKLNMSVSLRYAGKGYKVIAWNKSNVERATVYKEPHFKRGAYGSLEKGGGVVVNMAKVKQLTKKMKKKQLTWIPVYLHDRKKSTGLPVTGYVNAKNIALTVLNINRISSNSVVNKAVRYGYRHLGTQFILGGRSMTGGIDCAAFVKMIYEAAGKSMPYPHTSFLQNASRQISYGDLKPGDLIFYLANDTSGPIDHVAVYLGKNLMINASGHYGHYYPGGGITIKRIVYGKRRPARYMRLYGIN